MGGTCSSERNKSSMGMGTYEDLKDMIAKNAAIIESINADPTDPAVNAPVADCYYQHNLLVADTKAGYIKAFGEIFNNARESGNPITSKIYRKFADPSGPYTFFHVEYSFFGPKAGFDICRWEDGKIVEHWDNLQPLVTESVNGNTMFDGPTDVKDFEKTEANKELVRKFTFHVLCAGDLEQISKFVSEDYIQHDPAVKNGRKALEEQLSELKAKEEKYYNSMHLIVGCGNFVIATGQRGNFAHWDMYRVEKDKLVEHWNTIEELIPEETRAHKNGKW